MTQSFYSYFPPLLFPVLSCLFFLCTAQWRTHSDGSVCKEIFHWFKEQGFKLWGSRRAAGRIQHLKTFLPVPCACWEELTPSPNLPSTPSAPTAALDLCLSFPLLFCLLIFNLSHL